MASFIFFFNDTATTEIYTLSLHDALPILDIVGGLRRAAIGAGLPGGGLQLIAKIPLHQRQMGHLGHVARSEEHTSELQSRQYLVCRLLLEKKKIMARKTSICSTSRHQSL